MTNDERSTNDETRISRAELLGIRNSSFFRHSSLDIRHSAVGLEDSAHPTNSARRKSFQQRVRSFQNRHPSFHFGMVSFQNGRTSFQKKPRSFHFDPWSFQNGPRSFHFSMRSFQKNGRDFTVFRGSFHVFSPVAATRVSRHQGPIQRNHNPNHNIRAAKFAGRLRPTGDAGVGGAYLVKRPGAVFCGQRSPEDSAHPTNLTLTI